MWKWHILLFFCIFLGSCKTEKEKKIQNVLRGLIGRELIIPIELEAYIKDERIVLPDFYYENIKIVIYLEAKGCLNCKMDQILELNRLFSSENGFMDSWNVFFIFHVTSEFKQELLYNLKEIDFNYPIFLDLNGNFIKENVFLPKDEIYYSFLLDKNNKINLVGSPLKNQKMWNLYKTTLRDLKKDEV